MNQEKKYNGNNYFKKNFLRSIVDGSFFSKEIILKNINYISFLVFLGLIYIANRNHAERLLRETIKLKKEVEELKSEQLTISSKLMQISQQSYVEKIMKEQQLELYNSDTPPFKITLECQK